jgi:hypothetical protein
VQAIKGRYNTGFGQQGGISGGFKHGGPAAEIAPDNTHHFPSAETSELHIELLFCAIIAQLAVQGFEILVFAVAAPQIAGLNQLLE